LSGCRDILTQLKISIALSVKAERELSKKTPEYTRATAILKKKGNYSTYQKELIDIDFDENTEFDN
jgi:hypothetical protein